MSRELVSNHKKTGQYMKFVEPIREIDRFNKKRINKEIQEILNKIDDSNLVGDLGYNRNYNTKYQDRIDKELNIRNTFDNIKNLRKQLIVMEKNNKTDKIEEENFKHRDKIKKYLNADYESQQKMMSIYTDSAEIRYFNNLGFIICNNTRNIEKMKNIILV